MDKKYYAVFVVAAMIATWLIINLTAQPIYDLGACTINKFNCSDQPGWDGQCTDTIKDECCMEVRMCDGFETQSPEDCYTRYCTTEGKMCVPETQLAGGFVCRCTSAYN